MTAPLTSLPPLLLPRPAEISFDISSARPLGADAAVTIAPDPSLPHPQAYRLTIAPDAPRVRIAHRSEAGLRHALATIAQLRVQYGDHLPALEILDYPAVDTRAVMLDVSRDRIPTMAEFARLIPEFAALKLNHLQLYTEHTFAYGGHKEVWEGWEPITPDELAQIHAWCAGAGIELAANQNCFGHLGQWLRQPRYADLAETHGEWVFDCFKRSGPFSLCPVDAGSIEFVRDLLGQLLPLFPERGLSSGPVPLANVGCDETYDVGQGRSRREVERRGKAAVYFDFVEQVFDVVRGHGKRPMFWADVALSHPESVDRIPGDAVALAWGYEADADFDRWCQTLCGAGKTAWVCPGTSSWRSIVGRTSTRRANLLAAAEAAAKYNLPGYMVTDWGDAGHQQVWPVALVAIAEAADRAWNAGRPGDPDPHAISLHCFGDRSLAIASWLDELGDVDLPLHAHCGRDWFEGRGNPVKNASALFADLSEPWNSNAIGRDPDDPKILAAELTEWSEVMNRLPPLRDRMPTNLAPQLRAELDHTWGRATFASLRAVCRRVARLQRLTGAAQPLFASSESVKPLIGDLAGIIATHTALWLARSRPGKGLEHSLSYDQRLLDELRAL
ncbi:MAG TPA: family 20 glycosylhydrolase [Phycisphaerales bacterium]|nr:family 20 glycosylhydrolase [Phycisphaerales bacterium]